MSNTEIEIVVDDPTAPEADSPAVTSTRVVDVVVSLLLLVLAATLGWDNWRSGAAWDSTGPQPGYFPFYLSVILAGASLYGLVAAFLFWRFYQDTRDRFFIYFALAFVLEGASRLPFVFTDLADEDRPFMYLIRLAAYALILAAIWRKNRPGR